MEPQSFPSERCSLAEHKKRDCEK